MPNWQTSPIFNDPHPDISNATLIAYNFTPVLDAQKGCYSFETDAQSSPAVWVLRIFQFFLQNFGNLSQFWWILQNLVHIDFKILEKSLSRLWPHIGTNFLILENFDLANFVISPSYDKPPWRNFDFLSNFWFWWWKIEIWNP